MRKRQTIAILNAQFELCGTIEDKPNLYYGYRSLYQCYGRPSTAKEHIYDGWYHFFRSLKTDESEHGIISFSVHFFTYGGVVEWNNKKYYLVITYAHNRAYEIV